MVCPPSEPSTILRYGAVWVYAEADETPTKGLGTCAYDISGMVRLNLDSNTLDIASASDGGTTSSRFRTFLSGEPRVRLDLEKEARVPLDSISISQKLKAAPEAPIMKLR